MAYEVRTDVYEGPFDVLFRLITEQRVELYEVRLSAIVDAFLAEIDGLERVDLETATEFLLIAAVLVELKSRRLLPDRHDGVSDDDLALIEERDYLLARLVECTTFGAAGRALAELEQEASRCVGRAAGPDERFDGLVPDLLVGLTPDDLRQAAEHALTERALAEQHVPAIDVEHILVDEVTVADVVGRLVDSLPGTTPVTFRELTRLVTTPGEVVVHFLAVLELYKQGLVELDQIATFGDLVVSWTGDEADDTQDCLQPELMSVSLGSQAGPWRAGVDMEYRG